MSDATLFDVADKKALITGGAAGIGRSCALALAKAGADVAIVDLNEKHGEATATAIRKLGREAIYVGCNVTEAASVRAMIGAVVGKFGRLDIAVNNAGIYIRGADESQAKDEWDRVIAVNLTGTWLCAQAEMRQMIKQSPPEGKIINVASIGGVIASSNGSYDASKAAVVHLTKTLAAQWGRYNINVNCLSPGYVLSGIGARRSLEERERIREVVPMGHVQRPDDLHGPFLFLASRASDYMTGQNLVVDGGHTLGGWMVPLPSRAVPPRIAPEAEFGET